MKIIIYESLARKTIVPAIRWPGNSMMRHWPRLDDYSALFIRFEEKTAREWTGAAGTGRLHPLATSPIYLSTSDVNDSEVARFVMAQLLVRNWAKILHQDRIDIVTSDWPDIKNRVRTYKTLFDAKVRSQAIDFEQREVEVNSQASVLVNRIAIDSSVQYSRLSPLALGDTLRSFGIYDYSPSLRDGLFEQIVNCYDDQGRMWRWSLSQLLPVVCNDFASLLFFQGLASDTGLEMVVYLRREQVCDHVEMSVALFNAQVVSNIIGTPWEDPPKDDWS
ncbi:MAG: hypothetical protein GC200_09775 [Tepidisphaera sp.]|nr:hypothetical protein [Tepidisphaera sp.]